MNYENFSVEARNAIDQFRNFIEIVKKGKDKLDVKVKYRFEGNLAIPGNTQPLLEHVKAYLFSYLRTNRVSAEEFWEVDIFMREKFWFLPKFSSYENFEQNKHKYSFIE